MMSKPQFDMLRFISRRPITRTDLAHDIKPRDVESRLNVVRALVKLGYARDYGDQHGRRIPVNLRIWGITDAGKAVLEQQALAESKTRGGQGQLGLTLVPKELPIDIKFSKPVGKLREAKKIRDHQDGHTPHEVVTTEQPKE